MRKPNSSIASMVILLLFSLGFMQGVFAQKPAKTNIFPATGSAGIGTVTPHSSSLLEMKSTTQGFLPPRMGMQNMLGIVGPDRGLTVFVTDGDAPGYYYNNGVSTPQWLPLSQSSSGSGANQALSNLSNTAVNADLIPASNGSIDLGSSVLGWRNAFFTGQLNTSSVAANKISGNAISGITSGSGYGLYGKGGTYGIFGEGPTGIVGSGIKGVWGQGLTNDFLGNSYGLYGTASAVLGSTYGVYGSAGTYGVYGTSDNYGVYGTGGSYGIYGSTFSVGSYGVYGSSVQGIGISASSSSNHGLIVSTGDNASYYSGYFIGSVYSSGGYQVSDKNLKQNIHDLSNAMDIINKLHPSQYEFRQDGNYKLMNMPQGNHYGLIAQEVEKVLPNLIKETKFDPNIVKQIKPGEEQNKKNTTLKIEDEINFKAMNYTELIPIMIKGMQELSKTNEEKDAAIKDLQKQIDELKQMIKANSSATNDKLNQAQQTVDLSNIGSIEQNTPNPFTSSTSIHYNLLRNDGNAFINFYSSSGIVLKSVKLSAAGKGVVDIKTSELTSGIYQYSLVVDGKVIDTKQMVRLK